MRNSADMTIGLCVGVYVRGWDMIVWLQEEARCYERTATTAVESCWRSCRGCSSYSRCHSRSESVFGYDYSARHRVVS